MFKSTRKELDNLECRLEAKVKNSIENMERNFQNEMLEFRKLMVDKYFDTLEKIFRSNREISLISSLAKNTNGDDFKHLRAELMQPLLEARWKHNKKELGEKVEKTWGIKLVERRQALHDQMLQMEKQNQPPEKVRLMKAKIEELDTIIRSSHE